MVDFWIEVEFICLESEIWGSSWNREQVPGGRGFECAYVYLFRFGNMGELSEPRSSSRSSRF